MIYERKYKLLNTKTGQFEDISNAENLWDIVRHYLECMAIHDKFQNITFDIYRMNYIDKKTCKNYERSILGVYEIKEYKVNLIYLYDVKVVGKEDYENFDMLLYGSKENTVTYPKNNDELMKDLYQVFSSSSTLSLEEDEALIDAMKTLRKKYNK